MRIEPTSVIPEGHPARELLKSLPASIEERMLHVLIELRELLVDIADNTRPSGTKSRRKSAK